MCLGFKAVYSELDWLQANSMTLLIYQLFNNYTCFSFGPSIWACVLLSTTGYQSKIHFFDTVIVNHDVIILTSNPYKHPYKQFLPKWSLSHSPWDYPLHDIQGRSVYSSLMHNENENWGCKQWGYLTVHSRDQTDFFQKWLIRRLTQWYKHTVGKKIIKRTKSTNGKNCPRGVGSGQEMCFVICSSVPL